MVYGTVGGMTIHAQEGVLDREMKESSRGLEGRGRGWGGAKAVERETHIVTESS